MRPSVITCVSSLRNPSCRSEVHRGHPSGQWISAHPRRPHPPFWLTEVCSWCHLPLVFQWFLNATMTMWWRNTSREAWVWTTRKLAPSSPSVSLLMTTLLRLWVTSGCRLNPNHPPVLPHPPAVRVSHTHQHTAPAKIIPTRKPAAAHHQTAATGLSTKSGRNKENVDFVPLNISWQICSVSNKKKKKKVVREWSWQMQQGFGPPQVWIFKMHWCSDM